MPSSGKRALSRLRLEIFADSLPGLMSDPPAPSAAIELSRAARSSTCRRMFLGAGWLLIALLLAASFSVDLSATRHDGAVDFRNRITGARLLAHRIDPYHYLWHPGQPAEFCDIRNNPNMTVSKTTVTPAFLVFYLPLAALPYRSAEYAWLVMQWALLLGTVAIWARVSPSAACTFLMAAFATGLTYTTAWRWEAERGQCYTLILLLFACWLIRTSQTATGQIGARSDFIPGVIAGLLIALRPPFILLAPFLVLHRRGQLPGLAAGLVAGVALPMLLEPAIWWQYAGAMQANSDYYRHANLPPRPKQDFPSVIEGTPVGLLGNMAGFPFLDVTIYAILRRLEVTLPSVGLVIASIGLLFAIWLLMARRCSARVLLPSLAAWLFLTDFVLPTTRWEYYDVLILNVVLAGLAVSGRPPVVSWPLWLALPAAWWVEMAGHPPPALLYAPAALLATGALLHLFSRTAPSEGVSNLGVQSRQSSLVLGKL